MIEDPATMEAESAMVLDGLAVGVDHLQAIVVFLLSVSHPYASWVRAGSDARPARLADGMRKAWLAADEALRGLEAEGSEPSLTLESGAHLVIVQRLRAFGVAVCFTREAPLGFARVSARQIISTIGHELPLRDAPPPPQPPVVPRIEPPPPAATVPGEAAQPQALSSGPRGELDFARAEPPLDPADAAPDTTPPRSLVGDRVRALLSHLEAVAPDPHIVRLRVALRTGLGIEALVYPDQLTSDALLLVEAAAEDILGLDRGKLTEVSRP